MSKNLPRVAPLQRIVGIPITDPAEIAAAEEEFKRERRQQRACEAAGVPADLMSWTRQLSVEGRLALIRELLVTLSAEQQGDLIAQVVAQASNGVLEKLDLELRQRLNGQASCTNS
jgi:hypothetical protein